MSVKKYKALGNELRMDILKYLIDHGSSACVDIRERFFNVSQPTMSHHLGKLVDAGLITVEKVKTEKYYSVSFAGLLELMNEMKGLIDDIK